MSTETIVKKLKGIVNLERQIDGSIIIQVEVGINMYKTIQNIRKVIDDNSTQCLETPKYYYKIPFTTRQILAPWALAFEGCLATLLVSDPTVKPLCKMDWEYLNASTGGVYINPYTLFLYDTHPRIVHPITSQNYNARMLIEQKSSLYIRKMINRIQEVPSDMIGIALIAYVEEKSSLTKNDLINTIMKKSLRVKSRKTSPFFYPEAIDTDRSGMIPSFANTVYG